MKLIALPEHCHECFKPNENGLAWNETSHCIKMTITSCAHLLPSMLAFGLFDKIRPQLLSAVWHCVRRLWKTGIPIPQVFGKEVKKGKERQPGGIFTVMS